MISSLILVLATTVSLFGGGFLVAFGAYFGVTTARMVSRTLGATPVRLFTRQMSRDAIRRLSEYPRTSGAKSPSYRVHVNPNTKGTNRNAA